ncbi:hypothetical protein LEP1GSC072_3005 [Leptospira noguchii str. Bonito]|nr:hypothetical protein LEP1GSC072_3005 [Leptospira noguchii str. Bonito]
MQIKNSTSLFQSTPSKVRRRNTPNTSQNTNILEGFQSTPSKVRRRNGYGKKNCGD